MRELEKENARGTRDTTGTEKFCRMFDRFFDMLNTRSLTEGRKKRKPDLLPYYSANDKRFKVNMSVMHVLLSLYFTITTVASRGLLGLFG